MSNAPDRSLAMLDTALEMEKKGKEFYEGAIQTCKNEMGKEVFRTLKKDEDVHIARIVEIYDALKKGKAWGVEWKKLEFSHGDLAAFFSGLAKKHPGKSAAEAGDIQALEVGIDFELKSVAFYEGSLTGVSDPIEKDFIKKMIIEERSHHTILEDAKLYLTDPSSWFREHERGGLDGA